MAEEEIVVKLSVIDNMSKEISSIRAKMENDFKVANTAIKEQKGAFSDLGNEIKGNFIGAVKGMVLAYAGVAVIGKITGFLKEGREEYKEAVRVNSQLASALGYTSTALIEQADALGKKLMIDNEEIIGLQVKLANYIKNDDAVKKLTPAVLDLAAATGMDMASAANIVAKAVNDDSEELGKFKIQVDGACGSAERIDSVLAGLNSKFIGGAEAVTKSKDAFDQYGIALKDLEQDVFKKLTFGANVLFRTFSDLGRVLAGTSIKQVTQETAKYFEDLKSNYNGEVDAAKEAANKKISLERSAAELKEQIRKDNLEKYKKLKEEEKKVAEETKQTFIAAYTMQEESKIALMQDGMEKEFALLDLKYAMDLERYKGNKIMTIALEQQYSNQAQKLIEDENRKVSVSKINNIIAIQNAEARARQLKMSEDIKKAALDKQLAASAVSNQLGMMASLLAGQQKWKAAYKLLAISQALMDTFSSAQAAYKSAVSTPIIGPILGPIAATTATLAGLKNVNEIRKLETGTAYAGGQALVGENGPEIVNLPRGAQVYNNTQTRNMTTNAALNVTIMDSSGNITETVRAQLRSGQGDQLVRDIQTRMARMI